MISHRQASKLLPPGDTVYCVKGRLVIPAKVMSIKRDHLDTDIDVLFFDEHGTFWYLTEKEAAKAAARLEGL